MPYHYWGDEFDWGKLAKAMRFIYILSRLTGMKVWMKEKYGTVRYEMIFCWGFSKNKYICRLQFIGFKIVLVLACIRFYSIRKEILEDWLGHIDGLPIYFRPFIKENPWKTIK